MMSDIKNQNNEQLIKVHIKNNRAGEEVFRVTRARYEAARCMSCGRCNLCQECALFCPDAYIALARDGQAIQVDLEHCKGCGICAQECPRGVIGMEAAS